MPAVTKLVSTCVY